MQKILFILSLIAIPFMSIGQFSAARLTAAGLTCAMCTKAIFNSLEKTPGVSKVDVDIKTSAFVIQFQQGATVDPDALRAAVEDAGFSVAKLQLSGRFNNLAIGNDAHIQMGGKTFHFLKVSKEALNGEATVTLVDKNFVSAKEFKKYSSTTDHPCVETGKAEACCAKAGAKQYSRIYHVTL